MSTNTASLTNYHPKTPERRPEDYQDLLGQKRPQAKNPMSLDARAAQFAPYAALVGHKDIISAEESIMQEKINLDHEIIIEPDDDNFTQNIELDNYSTQFAESNNCLVQDSEPNDDYPI